jgi:hypothetical protein
MLAGLAGLVLFFVFWNRRSDRVVTQRAVYNETPAGYPPPAVTDQRVYEDPNAL